MLPTHRGSFRLFRLAGITVFLHWSWFLVAIYGATRYTEIFSSMVWSVVAYLGLFVIVLMHEFGHALACRQVGGRADQIVLWPLGGVAYVAPPHRPGATLWSIAAGPLVNVLLFPLFSIAVLISRSLGWETSLPNLATLIFTLWIINCLLLVFNLLPVYPLDGGQILRSLLWFVLGPARSLMIATMIGMVGVAFLVLLALWARDLWIGLIAVFILLNCGRGLLQARKLARMEAASRHAGYACPACGWMPPQGDFWLCPKCRQSFDLFQMHGVCRHCGTGYAAYPCLECGVVRPLDEWNTGGPPPSIWTGSVAAPPRL